jgi:hypothetical protein
VAKANAGAASANTQRHRLCIDLPDDAGHQEGGRDGTDSDRPPSQRERLAHVRQRCRGEACSQQALHASQKRHHGQ